MLSVLYKAVKPLFYRNNAHRVNALPDASSSFGAGWYMLEWQTAQETVGETSAVFDCLPKEGAAFVFSLPFRPGKMTKRIVYFPAPVMQVRVESIEGVKLHPRIFRLVSLRPHFAEDRMLQRLDGRFAESRRTIRQRLEQRSAVLGVPFLQVLYASYQRIFSHSGDEDYAYWVEVVEPERLAGFSSDSLIQFGEKDANGFQYAGNFALFCLPGYRLEKEAADIFMQVLRRNSSAVLVYADEDHIDSLGRRTNPYFKPDWNVDLFLSQDYLGCFLCRTSWLLAHQSIFNRYGVSGGLAYLLPHLPQQAIEHVPLVLSHRLAVEALSSSELKALRVAGMVSGFHESIGVDLLVESGFLPNSFHLRFPLPVIHPLVSLLVPTRDALAVLKPCIESILEKTDYKNFEILILDNQSREQATLDWFAEIVQDPRVRVLSYDHPFNYSAINNFGVKQARGQLIGLINNDVEVISPIWLSEMVSHILRPDIGCVGAKLYYSNTQIQHAGVVLGLGHVAGHAHRFATGSDDGYHGRLKLVQNYSAVTAACLLVRRDIYEQVGGLEEQYLPVAYNDVDFCLRVRAAGFRNLWTPYAELYHHESISRGDDDTPEKKARFEAEVAYMWERWGDELKNDPCYNPNLSRCRENFSLRDF